MPEEYRIWTENYVGRMEPLTNNYHITDYVESWFYAQPVPSRVQSDIFDLFLLYKEANLPGSKGYVYKILSRLQNIERARVKYNFKIRKEPI